MDTVISTWFVADESEWETRFPQTGDRSASREFQEVYWRCVAVFFATSARLNHGCRHVLFTNDRPPVVGAVDVASFLEGLSVEVVPLPITHRLPRGAWGEFGNQFYVLDVLSHVVRAAWSCRFLLLDSDCVWVRPVGSMASAIDEHRALTYEIPYPEDAQVNGLSRRELSRIAERLTGARLPDALPYCGGELIALHPSELTGVSERAEKLWEEGLRLRDSGRSSFNEEAQLLSIVYSLQGYAAGTANPFIKRMWTTLRTSNVGPRDRGLTLWHLPAEKKTGLKDLFVAAVDRRSGFWTTPAGPRFVEFLGRTLGVPSRSLRKWAVDIARKLGERLEDR